MWTQRTGTAKEYGDGKLDVVLEKYKTGKSRATKIAIATPHDEAIANSKGAASDVIQDQMEVVADDYKKPTKLTVRGRSGWSFGPGTIDLRRVQTAATVIF
ncbi:hypothetical protein C8034_v011954 [Colletotrichum sidae]|uniref:Uncharacterized protein n=1 Tax=Colletotrichum sidae TaxID=1347389 RepID=A0A4R8TL59_9PEZI|nr:hypothetical protein C8034_v011954 [Colletotrichum sidae]